MSIEIKISKNSNMTGKISRLKEKVEKTKSACHEIGGGGCVQASLFDVLNWTEILFGTYSRLYESSSKFIDKAIEAFDGMDRLAADKIKK